MNKYLKFGFYLLIYSIMMGSMISLLHIFFEVLINGVMRYAEPSKIILMTEIIVFLVVLCLSPILMVDLFRTVEKRDFE